MDRSKASIRDTYERIAPSYAASRTRPWPDVLDFVAALPPRSSVLDLGCGHGRHVRPLAAAGHGVVGLDFSRRLLTIGRGTPPGPETRSLVEWILGEATALPFHDSSFDAATCVAVLHHLPSRDDRHAALAELRRVLRPGGRALFSVWARDDPYLRDVLGSESDAVDVEIPWHLPDGVVVLRVYHLFQQGELERLIIDSGLRTERFFREAGNYFALATNDG